MRARFSINGDGTSLTMVSAHATTVTGPGPVPARSWMTAKPALSESATGDHGDTRRPRYTAGKGGDHVRLLDGTDRNLHRRVRNPTLRPRHLGPFDQRVHATDRGDEQYIDPVDGAVVCIQHGRREVD